MHGLDPGGASACFTSSERLSDTEFADDFDPSSPPGPSSFLTAADDMEARLSRPSPHTRIPEAETPRKSDGGGAVGDGAGGMCWSPAWLPSEEDIFNDPISGDSTMLHEAPPFVGNSGGSGGSRGYQGESGPGIGTGAMPAVSGGGNRGMAGMSGGNSPFEVNLSGTDSAGLLLSRTSPMPGMTVQDLIMAVDSVSFATPAPHGSRAIGGGSDGGSFNNALSYTNGPSSNNAPSSYTNAPSFTNGPSYAANQSPEPWSLTSYYDTPVSDILCETGQASTSARPFDMSRHAGSTGNNSAVTVKEEATRASSSPGGGASGGAGVPRAGASVDLTCEEDEFKLSLDAAEENDGGGAAAAGGGAGGGAKGGAFKHATLKTDPNPTGHSDTVMQLQYAGGNGPLGFGYKMVPRTASMTTTAPSSLPSLAGGASSAAPDSASAAGAAAQAARGGGDVGGFMDEMEEDEDDDMMGGGVGGYSRKRGFVQNAAASAARKRRHDMNHRVKRLLDLVPVSNKVSYHSKVIDYPCAQLH
ncbi:unnamed protein product [Closterium sp. Yama58-4]|nr:unnamed protein product [Closterium sp. Yama58-4]